MAVNKTLYVRDEDAPIWDKARELVGDKLSTFVMNHLKQFVASKEAATGGFHRIVLTYREQGRLPRSKAFFGRWIIHPESPWEQPQGDNWGNESGPPDLYAVAITSKNNIVVFNFYDLTDEGRYRYGDLNVFESFDEALTHSDIPNDLIATAMENLGVEVEELDI